MTPKTELQDLFAHAAEHAALIFEKKGEFVPMWHAIDRDGENLVIVTPWADHDQKHVIVDHLRAFFRERGVTRYAFMCEAWSLVTPDLNDYDRYAGRLNEHPDRREILTIQAEDKDGNQVAGWYYILRPEHAPATLSPLTMSDADHTEGALAGMLIERGKP